MIVLTVEPDDLGRLSIRPSSALTDDLRQFVRDNKERFVELGGRQILVIADPDTGEAGTCYEWQERAAIIEYEAGETREAAEQAAVAQMCAECAHFARPGRSDGYCGAPARRDYLAPAYGEGHPLRKLPDDLGASCPAWSDGAVTQ